MIPADWAAIEDCIFAVVAAETGYLAPDGVLWEKQNMPRPQADHATLYHDWGNVAGCSDESVTSDTEGSPAGEEITLTTRAHTDFILTVKAFTTFAQGASCAAAVCARLRNALSKQSVTDTLAAAGIAYIDAASVVNLDGMLETRFEGQAALSITLRVEDGTIETATNIETVKIKGTVDEVALPDIVISAP